MSGTNSIYKSPEAKKRVLALYDAQMKRIGCPFKDLYVNTSFGKAHIIETGNPEGIPLLVFHGGNASTAYNLLLCGFLLEKFHIYAPDTVGHPGKSSETVLSASSYDYGRWASELITELGFEKMACFGGSFGAGIIVKAMCIAPEKIDKAVLYIPSGIKNEIPIKMAAMLFPLIMYKITHKNEWLVKSFLPMAITADNISSDMLETARCNIDNCSVKTAMPSSLVPNEIKKYNAPTLVMAAENDCLFPASMVIPVAEKSIHGAKTYLLAGRGHIHNLADEEKTMICDFLCGNEEKAAEESEKQ